MTGYLLAFLTRVWEGKPHLMHQVVLQLWLTRRQMDGPRVKRTSPRWQYNKRNGAKRSTDNGVAWQPIVPSAACESMEAPHGHESAWRKADHARCVDTRVDHAPFHDWFLGGSISLEPPRR